MKVTKTFYSETIVYVVEELLYVHVQWNFSVIWIVVCSGVHIALDALALSLLSKSTYPASFLVLWILLPKVSPSPRPRFPVNIQAWWRLGPFLRWPCIWDFLGVVPNCNGLTLRVKKKFQISIASNELFFHFYNFSCVQLLKLLEKLIWRRSLLQPVKAFAEALCFQIPFICEIRVCRLL